MKLTPGVNDPGKTTYMSRTWGNRIYYPKLVINIDKINTHTFEEK